MANQVKKRAWQERPKPWLDIRVGETIEVRSSHKCPPGYYRSGMLLYGLSVGKSFGLIKVAKGIYNLKRYK